VIYRHFFILFIVYVILCRIIFLFCVVNLLVGPAFMGQLLFKRNWWRVFILLFYYFIFILLLLFEKFSFLWGYICSNFSEFLDDIFF
jgi:hypothetical protein